MRCYSHDQGHLSDGVSRSATGGVAMGSGWAATRVLGRGSRMLGQILSVLNKNWNQPKLKPWLSW
jgi:hypothetical protein